MEIGIIGLAQSGRSTLFEIMTGIKSREIFGEETVRGVAAVPDQRFGRLVAIFKPKKVSPAVVPFIDTAVAGDDAMTKLRGALSTADGLLHIIDCFSIANLSEAAARYRKLADELVFADLVVVETRLERLAKYPVASLKGEDVIHSRILPRAKEALEGGKPLRDLKWSDAEIFAMRGFTFWTLKPELIVLNISENSQISAEEFSKLISTSSPSITICCQAEVEIAQLAADERIEFLSAMGIKEPAFERIIRGSFSLLNRICYFTVGEDEVKAWVIPTGSTAPRAAAAIHKDFERGFIKAEVASYEDFVACGESLACAKAAGKLRLEGKEYIVKDGDIISFRFNV